MQKIRPDKTWFYFYKSLPFLKVTLIYVLVSLILGFIIGAIVAKGKMSKHKLLRALASIYVSITRCTPSIVLLFLVFYGLPAVLYDSFGIDINGIDTVFFVCITFSIFLGASSSEIIRGAYEAVSKGQFEAGLSVGLSEFQTFIRIILPQMLKFAMPNIGNMVIFMFKEGALCYTIGLRDVLGEAYFLSSKEFNAYSLSMYIALTFIYWPITIILERAFGYFEWKLTPKLSNEELTTKLGEEA